MRTTVTLDPDIAALLTKYMKETGVSFKKALNDALRSALAPKSTGERIGVRTRSMGRPSVSLDKALQLASAVEDEEIVRKLELRK
ncbi:antitoxin [Nocardia cyriacigeorgica]|uniref:Antitoxin n=1 Tax=Nocardia cyriacigeorgica TaxID=135487 RepID=A0A6P1D5S6_9NOCA|nr:antitoxin [Nocardia cyriacigeorgica]NEW41411.1 antitoxin [Nocardia cyriacigeorgica]NEW44744.1 antitoxin [Nocardia cyriacigeorgica]NEW50854.1 antitoxin [Nocardia cyriacigeorgica]NEW57840.1 antitoxin [Nocardia cyriacigeorgica]